MAKRVAVVTGSNKGLGLAIVKGLCREFDGDVILTARNEEKGLAAVENCKKDDLHPLFHQLDVTDTGSIEHLRDFLKGKYHGLDVLVNNAGVYLDLISSEPLSKFVSESVEVNYTSPLRVSEMLFPLLRPHARVCNMSSLMAQHSLQNCSSEVRAKFLKENLTIDELTQLMQQYVRAVEDEKHLEEGFANNTYGMSKIGLSIMSTIQQRELDKKGAEDIVVNSCTPGYVMTDMTQGKGNLTVEEGAVTPLYLCLLPPDISSPRGVMVREKKICDWTKTS